MDPMNISQGDLDPVDYVYVAKPSYQEVKYKKITGLTDGSIRCPITKSSGLTNGSIGSEDILQIQFLGLIVKHSHSI